MVSCISNGWSSDECYNSADGTGQCADAYGNNVCDDMNADNLDFDQLILEFYTPGIPDSGWVHVSYKTEGNRQSILTAMKENGKTVYKPGLIQ